MLNENDKIFFENLENLYSKSKNIFLCSKCNEFEYINYIILNNIPNIKSKCNNNHYFTEKLENFLEKNLSLKIENSKTDKENKNILTDYEKNVFLSKIVEAKNYINKVELIKFRIIKEIEDNFENFKNRNVNQIVLLKKLYEFYKININNNNINIICENIKNILFNKDNLNENISSNDFLLFLTNPSNDIIIQNNKNINFKNNKNYFNTSPKIYVKKGTNKTYNIKSNNLNNNNHSIENLNISNFSLHDNFNVRLINNINEEKNITNNKNTNYNTGQDIITIPIQFKTKSQKNSDKRLTPNNNNKKISIFEMNYKSYNNNNIEKERKNLSKSIDKYSISFSDEKYEIKNKEFNLNNVDNKSNKLKDKNSEKINNIKNEKFNNNLNKLNEHKIHEKIIINNKKIDDNNIKKNVENNNSKVECIIIEEPSKENLEILNNEKINEENNNNKIIKEILYEIINSIQLTSKKEKINKNIQNNNDIHYKKINEIRNKNLNNNNENKNKISPIKQILLSQSNENEKLSEKKIKFEPPLLKKVINSPRKNIRNKSFLNSIEKNLSFQKEKNDFSLILNEDDNNKLNLLFKLTEHKKIISCLLVLSNGNLVSSSHDNYVNFYNSEKNFELDFNIKFDNKIYYLTELNDDFIVICTSFLQIIKLNNNNKNKYEIFQNLYGHKKNVFKSIQLKNCDFISIGEDKFIRFWEKLNARKRYSNYLYFKNNSLMNCILRIKEFEIVTSSFLDSKIEFWNFKNKNKNQSQIKTLEKIDCSNNADNMILFDNNLIIIGNLIYVVNIESYNVIKEIKYNEIMLNTILDISDFVFVIGDYQGNLIEFRIDENSDIKKIGEKRLHNGKIEAIMIFEDGKIVSGGEDCVINIWKSIKI